MFSLTFLSSLLKLSNLEPDQPPVERDITNREGKPAKIKKTRGSMAKGGNRTIYKDRSHKQMYF